MDALPSTSSNGGTTSQAMLVQVTTDGVPKLHCPMCNKALFSLNGYVKHVKKHEPPGGFLCRYCDARYCSDEELKRHREAVHTTIACRICDNVTFTSENDYRAHISEVHNGIDRVMYTCDKCGAEYKTVEPFKRHLVSQCGTVKPHKCDLCPMAFVTKYNLKQHKESHTGIPKYCCSYCGKNFLQKGRLIDHERSHTGEKPYKCDVCGKCFAHRESIVTHSSIHTGIRLVECRCCLSRFSCYSNLIKHRRARMETCGLPQYDPPKNRVRTHRSRIPPTLNPTSEIKVSNMNKVIKPDDKEHIKKPAKKCTEEQPVRACTAAEKRRGRPVGSKANNMQQPEAPESFIKSEQPIAEANSDSSDDDVPLKLRLKRSRTQKPPTAKVNTEKSSADAGHNNSTHWSDCDSDGDCGDFEQAESESDDQKDFKNIKCEQSETETETNANCAEPAAVDAGEFVNVKTEDDGDIFNEKDKLLDCLLNDELDGGANMTGERLSFDSNKSKLSVKSEDSILEETEVVLIKHEDDAGLVEEDVLDVKNITDAERASCKIMLKDIKEKYPELKAKNSVKVARNSTKKKKKSEPSVDTKEPRKRGRKRKYLKSEDSDEATPPRRLSRITHQELKERLKMKTEEKSWSCPHCIKIYHMKKPFEKHLRDDHKLPAEEINKLCQSDELNVTTDEVFKCKYCGKIYLMYKRLKSHEKLHGPNGDLMHKCPCYCSVYFATKDEATEHARQEHRDLLFCELCQKYMTGHDSLKNHMRNHHQQERGESRTSKRNLVCDKCGKKFSGRTSLTDHVRSDCGRKPLYPCTVCGKHLSTAGILKTHLLLHKDETPFQCDQCGKTFKVKAQYKTHLKTRHTDYKPYKCHLCPKEYPYRESLLTHMTVHTGIKRFLCNGCGKRFTCISNLQAHRKVQADTCGQLPLNAKATQYMGVQKGNLLLGAKPEAGVDYSETNTLIAKQVIDRDQPMAQELNYPSEPSAPLATVPLKYASGLTVPQLLLPSAQQFNA